MLDLPSEGDRNPSPATFGRYIRRWTSGRDVIFHGTCYATRILTEGRFRFSGAGGEAVSFTRSPEVAAYWALLRRPSGETRGAVLVFDRVAMKSRFKLQPVHHPILSTHPYLRDETEERVCRRDTDRLPLLLFAVIWETGDVAPNLPMWVL
ncbi:MAG: hypothetical protein EOS51_27275 [Mesorhizobium sp.]|uniref:hypothetical protein n=1 Tax=unclassified Mesorhizobium TaxID=325217 RepID=UPI000FE4E0EA|nr:MULTISPECIES: hypothetical protein [unclassified Mesorhizobium]RWC07589.1 MAG: hypothetical protein EOS51_27275 [Mesorhizobium sp.]TGT93866.1 hypothetical protein EN807_26825 [Mesorhizobium sp. M5C.F.Ca.ET.164.01.1.1]